MLPSSELPRAEAMWREELSALAQQKPHPKHRKRLTTLTLLMISCGFGDDVKAKRHARSLMETALRALAGTPYAHELSCAMASSAASSGDFEAAGVWLSRCDPVSGYLDVYSAFVATHAGIANRRGAFEETLRIVGSREADIPIADHRRVNVGGLRAVALERLGRTDEAIKSLLPVLRWSRSARAAMRAFAKPAPGAGPVPAEALDRAEAIVARERLFFWGPIGAVAAVAAVVAALYFLPGHGAGSTSNGAGAGRSGAPSSRHTAGGTPRR
jgi:hypothetical protein